jgi:hypothetical protein
LTALLFIEKIIKLYMKNGAMLIGITVLVILLMISGISSQMPEKTGQECEGKDCESEEINPYILTERGIYEALFNGEEEISCRRN